MAVQPTGRLIMLQGTGSDVGKSVLVAALGRALTRRGYRVAPFKPQNMANNAAPATDGGELGRAQALQARACRRPPITAMNPVLLKPQAGGTAQLVKRGTVAEALPAHTYQHRKAALLPEVLASAAELAASANFVLVEGAGSPAEINLRAGDIANMGFARAAGAPVALVGDIDRGGVLAQLYGTWALLEAADRAHLAGFIVNRFRGDPKLFAEGRQHLGELTGLADFGLVPHCPAAADLPAEDSFGVPAPPTAPRGSQLHIAVPRLPHIANFDDLDPLRTESGVALDFVPPERALPACDVVVLPGSKAVRADLAALRETGWATDLAAHVRRGGRVLGLCGGYQMLGSRVADPDGREGPPGESEGLGYLPVATTLLGTKAVGYRRLVAGWDASVALTGYEMHMGRTTAEHPVEPLFRDGETGAGWGAVSPDGRVMGAYFHGILRGDAGRRSLLARLGGAGDPDLAFESRVEAALERLADHAEAHLAIDSLIDRALPLDSYADTGARDAS